MKHKNLQMVWVDYKIAYDSVPHTWIIKCLELCRYSCGLVQFLKLSMEQWKTVVSVNKLELGTVSIRIPCLHYCLLWNFSHYL